MSDTQTIVLGGGCFWCTEAVYERVRGVVAVESGYSNGRVARPTYEQVCTGDTGCVEVVRVRFDPAQITLREVLEIFFVVHDPTTLNRQGNDVGEQYRSIAFYRNAEQKAAIDRAIAEAAASGEWHGRIVTQVVPFRQFYKAEDYHQEYFKLHGTQPYCQLVIAPKVAKFRKLFHDQLK